MGFYWCKKCYLIIKNWFYLIANDKVKTRQDSQEPWRPRWYSQRGLNQTNVGSVYSSEPNDPIGPIYKEWLGRAKWCTWIVTLLFIFKAQHTNSVWIFFNIFLNWHFSTSNSGWIFDSHGYEWLITVFEPNLHLEDHMQWHLFIMDSYNSYIIANFIAFCIKYLIDLFILFPHILHLLQPFDIDVFALLKCTLAEKTDAVFWLNFNCISHANWISMFV